MAMGSGDIYDANLLRSVLLSIQGGLPISQVEHEHKMLIGAPIPYRSMGFQSLEDYLMSIPDVVTVKRSPAGTLVFAVTSDKTQHIASLVARQKSTKSNKKNRFTKGAPVRPPVRLFNQDRNWNRPFHDNTKRFLPPPSQPPSWNSSYSHVNAKPFEQFKSVPAPLNRPMHSFPRPPCVPPSSNYYDFGSKESPKPIYQQNPYPYAEPPKPVYQQNSFVAPPKPVERPKYVEPQRTFDLPKPVSVPIASQPKPECPPKVESPKPTSVSKFDSSKPGITVSANYERERSMNVNAPSPATTEIPPRFQRLKSLDLPVECPKTYKQFLEDYVLRKNLGTLVFKTFPMRMKHLELFVATVTVKGKTYGSYPLETLTPQEAQEAAAKKAIDSLGVLDKGVRNTNKKMSSDLKTILQRVQSIVEEHPYGVVASEVPNEYAKKFNEPLVDGWLDSMTKNKMISAELCAGQRMIVYPIVEKTQNGVSHSTSETSSSNDSTLTRSDIPVAQNSQKLILPDKEYWSVFVAHVVSTNDMSIRLVDYSEAYDDMANNMELYYMEDVNCVRAEKVVEGNVYAGKVDDSWHRIQVITIAEKNAVCTFLDNGDNDTIALDNIYTLAPHFQQLPYQAIHCCLHGLQDYAKNSDGFVYLVENVLGKTLIAQIVERGDVISVVLYDTSTKEDVNINEILQDHLCEASNSLYMQDGKILQASILDIDNDGLLSVQLLSRCFDMLEESMKDIQERCVDYPTPTTISKENLYLARYPVDKLWYRAQVLDEDKDKVSVYYVDYGNISVIPASDVKELAAFNAILLKIPHQVLQCRLHCIPPSENLEWTPRVKERLVEIASSQQVLLLKIVSGMEKNRTPLVELFKRSEVNNELVSINQTLAYDRLLYRRRSSDDKSDKSLTSIFRSLELKDASSESSSDRSESSDKKICNITAPDVPGVGQYVDIDIMLAVSPSNFVCQLRNQGLEFDGLQEDMKHYFALQENRKEVTANDIIIGDVYAHELKVDKMWYRAQVKDTCLNSVSIYLIDFGNTLIVSFNELYFLPSRYKALPYQAVYGKLAAIVPLYGDWRPEDCIRFQSLVLERAFVALIVQKDESGDCTSFVVDLFDVSNDNHDLNIAALLVNENRAKMIKS